MDMNISTSTEGTQRPFINTTNVSYSGITDANVSEISRSVLYAGIVVNAILLFTNFWILLSMTVYGTKTKRWKKSSGTSSLHSGMIYVACVITVLLSLPRLIVQTVNFALNREGIFLCELIMDVYNTVGSVSIYSIYFILWLRQRVIYRHPSVRELNSTSVKILSFVSLICSTVFAAAFIGFFVIPQSYEVKQYGCQLQIKGYTVPVNVGIGTLSIISEILLLGLFIYPIVHANTTKDEYDPTAATAALPKSRTKEKITLAWRALSGTTGHVTSPIAQTIRVSAISSIVTVVTDISSIIIVNVIPLQVPRLVILTVYDVNNLINLFCAVATFRNAGSILSVLCISMKCFTVTSSSETRTTINYRRDVENPRVNEVKQEKLDHTATNVST